MPNTPNISPELQAALAARSTGQAPQGQLNQTNASAAPTVNQSDSFNAGPKQSPMGQKMNLPEVQLLEKALMDRIKHISNLEKQSSGISKPQGSSQPNIQNMPVGG